MMNTSNSSGKSNVGLAPMEGVTDFATRLWFAKTSAPEFCWTPFYRATASSTGILPEDFAPELEHLKSYIPYQLIPQVMTGDAEQFCKIADSLLKLTDFVDLNCGCPSSTVVGRGSGSSLLETSEKFSSLVYKISSRLGPEKLSVKMRLGYNDPEEVYSLVESIGELKIKRLTIHGRTRPQKYSGQADWTKIARASEMCSFPVVGSGDIFSQTIFRDFSQRATRIKTFIIGRGAVRNPWIFSEIRDQREVKINFETLLLSIVSFAVMQYLQVHHLEKLFSLVKEGKFQNVCRTDHDKWSELLSNLTDEKLEEIKLNSFGLARLKMLWNHVRTSLPERFWTGLPLRSKSLAEFVYCLREIQKGCDSTLALSHNKNWDWLFGGEKKTTH